MNIGLLSILHNKKWDFHPGMAQTYATALKNAIELHLDNDIEKKRGFFLSKKGCQKDGQTIGADFSERLLYSDIHVGFDKTYVGNIESIERHLYWNDEQLQDDDEIINVVVVDGPITRDGGGCSYGSKDWRDQVMYANTIPQVVGHLFVVNTPGGESAARNDYDMMIADCREKGKPTVTLVDGECYSSGVNLACRTDYVIVMNPKDGFGCIGSMVAFWAVAHDTVDQDGFRYVELVGKDCPEKNAWWREAAKGEYEKLQEDLDKDTEEFQQTVRENRPLVTDDMLSGKVFEAQEVIPALVDEIGNMDRAIECIFALANKEMQPARFMTAPDPDGEGGDPIGEPGDEPDPDELAKLNAQQKAAINKEKGNLTVVDDGHVTAERQGLFGPHMEEIATPKNDTEMTDEEKKAAEAEAAKAAEKNDEAAQAEGQQAGGQAAGEGAGEGAQEGAGEGSQEGAGEGAQEGAQEGTGEGTGDGEGEGSGEGEGAGEGEGTGEGAGEGEGSGEGSGDRNSEKSIEDAQAEIDKIQETLHSAEQMIADRDKEIESLKESLATLQGIAEERDAAVQERNDVSASLEKAGQDYAEQGKQLADAQAKLAEHEATIEKLKNQVADLKAEVKELSGKETPMVDAAAGVPAGNGTGAAPQAFEKEITRENMSYEHCREVKKAREAAKKQK